MKRLGIGLMILGGLTACGKSDETSSHSGATITPGAGRLPVSELAKPTGLAAISRSEVIIFMESNRSDFLATEAELPEEAETVDEEGEVDCFGDAFSSVEVQVDGDKLSVNVDIDLTNCLKTVWSQENEGVTADISKAAMSIYLEQTCEGADLSSFQGKNLNTMEDPPVCDNNRVLMNMKSEMIATMTADGQTVDIHSNTVNGIGTATNEPCLMTRSGENLSEDGCIETFKSTGPEGSEDNEYSRYSGKALAWVDSAKNTWFVSGSYDVELNDWAGSVTFRGSDINPLYTMKYGTETINGTLTVPAGLYFQHPLQRVLLRGAPRLKKRF